MDTLFQDLEGRVPPPTKKKKQEAKRPWLSDQSLTLLDTRSALRRNPFHDRAEARRLYRQIKVSLYKDRKARTGLPDRK
jgi:hypothetical protein